MLYSDSLSVAQVITTSDGSQIAVPPSRATIKMESHPPELRVKGYELYKADVKLPQIADALGLPVSTVCHWSSDEGWKARKQAELSGQPIEAKITVLSSSATDRVVPADFAEKQAFFTDKTAEAAVRIAERMAELTGQELISSADRVSKAFAMGQKALRLTEDKAISIVLIPLLNGGSRQQEKLVESARLVDDQPELGLDNG